MGRQIGTIAKNTVMLYFRMAVVMILTFWTSRAILEKLGIEDFGIYNVVGGVVVLFTFLNSALSGATQRFLNFELGKGTDEQLQKVFNASLVIHFFIAAAISILSETAGLWFLNTQLNIPAERMVAANWTFQLSVAGMFVSVIRVPWNALVIAHERMSFLAWLSITESAAKLGIVFLIGFGSSDRLIFYAILMFLVIAIATAINVVFCKKKFPATVRFFFPREQKLFKEILSYSGWNLISGVAILSATQGGNMLMNVFCGVVVNAAMGIANQVNGAVYQFVSNFQTAFNPQIVKSYAENDKEYFFGLIFGASKISYFLLLFIAVPVFVNAEFLLKLWLGTVPEYATTFVRLTLIFSLIDALNGPLWVSIGATGDIRVYAICVSSLNLLNLPLSYFTLRTGAPAESVLYVRIAVNIAMTVSRIIILRKQISLPVRKYLKKVCLPAACASVVCIPFPFLLFQTIENEWIAFFSTGTLWVVLCVPAIWCAGIDKTERSFVAEYVKKITRKFLKKTA